LVLLSTEQYTEPMEKERILHLVNKRISGSVLPAEAAELQNLLQKRMGISDAHKILLHLYNIESLVTASEMVQLEKLQEGWQLATACRKERLKTTSERPPHKYLSPHFFIRNNLFKIYCALTLRHLNRILC
jgi:hypothetical protein